MTTAKLRNSTGNSVRISGEKIVTRYSNDSAVSAVTLNIGFHYDLPLAKTEAERGTGSFNPKLPNPGAGGFPGAVEFTGTGAGKNGQDRFLETRYNALGPRLGLASQVTPKMVLRAGGARASLAPAREPRSRW